MKLLMIISRVPWPLDKGDKLRAYHQAKELAKNHEVFLCCLSDRTPDTEALAELQKIVQHVKIIRLNKVGIAFRLFTALFSTKPFQVHYFYQNHARKKIDRLISAFEPDHLYCQMIRTSEYIKHYLHHRKTIDYMDALSKGYQRRISGSSGIMKFFIKSEYQRLAGYEHLIFDYFDYHTIISNQDKGFIYHNESKRIAVIPNGIDKEYFFPTPRIPEYDLVFTGNMSYPPNIEAALTLINDILPEIRKTIPHARLLIAGTNPATSLTKAASENVIVSGWMPDIRSAYSSAKVFVAPMWLGSGLQNKLLEAMSMEMPCVTSDLANNALKADAGTAILIGSTNTEIAQACVRLLKDEELQNSIASKGKEYVQSTFSWQGSIKELERLWNNNSSQLHE